MDNPRMDIIPYRFALENLELGKQIFAAPAHLYWRLDWRIK
jgi:hypothetical protein